MMHSDQDEFRKKAVHPGIDPGFYNEVTYSHFPHQDAFLDSMLSFLPRRPGRILELASGTTLMTEMVQDLAPKAEIVCLEGPGEMTGDVRDPPHPEPATLPMRGARETRPKGRFDCVLSSFYMHRLHLEERAIVLPRIVDCLLPGGRFICGDVFCTEYRWVEKVIRYQWIAHMMKMRVPEEIMQAMIAEREAHYQEFDTVKKFRQRMQQSGFSRELVPFTSGFLGVVVGCVSNRGVTTGYLE